MKELKAIKLQYIEEYKNEELEMVSTRWNKITIPSEYITWLNVNNIKTKLSVFPDAETQQMVTNDLKYAEDVTINLNTEKMDDEFKKELVKILKNTRIHAICLKYERCDDEWLWVEGSFFEAHNPNQKVAESKKYITVNIK